MATSCELFNGLDTEPQQSLTPEQAVQNANDAASVLTGTYSFLNQDGYYSRMHPVYGSVLSGYFGSTSGTTRDITFQSETNSVQPADNTLGNSWDDVYEVANAASNTITLVGALSDEGFTGNRRQEIIAEAHFLRALSHFDALRFWGRFWDMSSDLGIPLRLEPGDASNSQLPRSTVSDVYNSIMADLDVTIATGPEFSVPYFASRSAATALKARVALYAKDYALAAQLANDVIQNGPFDLEENFADIYANKLNSPELIFGMFASQTETSGHAFFALSPSSGGRYDYAPSQSLLDLMSGDPREATTINISPDGPEQAKFISLTAADDPTYIIRLAELYLILAEALVQTGDVAGGLDALNTIRARAGVEAIAETDPNVLLVEIQLEKVRELVFEGSHEWFDAIRLENIQALKPSVVSDNQFVLPIPDIEVDPNNELEQNPGY